MKLTNLGRATLIVLVAGCGSGGARPGAEGVLPSPSESIEVVEELAIGSGDLFFSIVPAIAVGDDGEIFVVEGRAPSQVYRFNANGDSVGVVGRSGEGPGEYQRAAYLRVWPDSIVVFDGRTSVFNTYNSDGTARRKGERISDGSLFFSPVGFTGAELVVQGSQPFTPDGTDAAESMTTFGVYDSPGKLRDTLWARPAPEGLVVRTSNSVTVYSKPYGRNYRAAVSGDTLYVVWTGEVRVHALTLSGETLGSIGVEYDPVPLTADQRAGAFERLPEDFRPLLVLDETHPAIEGLVADDQGRVWLKIRKDLSDDSHYWVINPVRQEVVSVTFGPRFSLYVVKDGKAYGVQRTEDGEPLVVRYRIVDQV